MSLNITNAYRFQASWNDNKYKAFFKTKTKMISIICIFFYFFLGIAFGSFANVVIMRLHSGEKGILKGRSHCAKCNHSLSVWDLIPLFSWLFLKGKCRYCHKPISFQYPLVEFVMGAMFVAAYIASVFVANQSPFYEIWLLAIFFPFTILFIYDLLYMQLPDEVSLPAIVVLFGFTFLDFTPTWQDALIGAAIPLGFFGAQYLISKGKWIGEGDFRLGILMGFILGWKLTIVALFLSYILGSIVGVYVLASKSKKMSSQLPFGPFLILGTIITLFAGNEILDWYLGFLGF